MSLKNKGVAGVMWTFLQQFSSQIISFGVSLVLARLLLPKDFGTIALFNILIGVSTVIINSGMVLSLVRTKDADEEDYSTVFWFNILLSLIMYGVVFFIAPLFSEFYNLPELTDIIRVFSVILVINALSAIQMSLLTKSMDFRKQFKIQIPSLIISGLIALLLAYKGYGIWTLVWMPIIQSVLQAIQLWLTSNWHPRFIFVKNKFIKHYRFGVNLMLSSLLDIVFQNIYTVIIGKVFSPTQLGYYDRANNLKQLPVNNLAIALNKVTYPLFSEIQHDNTKLKMAYSKIMKMVIFVIAPILVVLLVMAEPLVRFLLTEKWMAVVPFLQILILAGILQPIHSYNINLLQIKGKTRLVLYLEIFKKILVVLVIVCSLQFGILGLLWGQVLISVLSFFINSKYSGDLIGYNSFQQMKDLMPTILLAFFIGALVYYFDSVITSNCKDIFRLIINIPLYLLLYIAFSYLLKMSSFIEIKELVLSKIKKKD